VRLVRYAHDGTTAVGVLQGDAVRRLGDDYPTVAQALQDPEGAERSAEGAEPLPLSEATLLAPVDATARVFAVAQNYPAHAQEVSGTGSPPAPVVFLKPASALVGADEAIELPPVTDFLDYEAEVAVVVGKPGRRLDEADADAVVFGVTCFNDVSARDLQPAVLGGKEIIDWFSAKSLDRSSPIGPWTVSLGQLDGDPSDLGLRCRLNGELVQEDRTSSMVSSVARLLSFVSHRVALRPGDVIATGTPGGVGRARGIKLQDGDVVEVEVDGVGTLRNAVRRVR
jgi:2-keto-4-pentenoate hydratase/2-oxohepta-3-ene-1,7-dioic acid hydratase in catechol pathway